MAIDRAKALRKSMTEAERCLWSHLRSKQLLDCKFRRQHQLGSYIVDFVCLERKLVIEVDGSQHLEQADADRQRTKWLEDRGYTVVRYWNNQVLNETESVLEHIVGVLGSPPPRPSPVEGEGGESIMD